MCECVSFWVCLAQFNIHSLNGFYRLKTPLVPIPQNPCCPFMLRSFSLERHCSQFSLFICLYNFLWLSWLLWLSCHGGPSRFFWWNQLKKPGNSLFHGSCIPLMISRNLSQLISPKLASSFSPLHRGCFFLLAEVWKHPAAADENY